MQSLLLDVFALFFIFCESVLNIFYNFVPSNFVLLCRKSANLKFSARNCMNLQMQQKGQMQKKLWLDFRFVHHVQRRFKQISLYHLLCFFRIHLPASISVSYCLNEETLHTVSCLLQQHLQDSVPDHHLS